MAARRRKVHSTPFPPGGENCVRSLAPPLPGKPASLGFAGSNEGLGKTPPGPTPLIKGRCPEGTEGIGTGSDEHFVLIVAFPRTPFTGAPPETDLDPSGAQNQECLPAVPSGPTGALSGRKFAASAVSLPRLGLPSQRNRCESRREAQGGLPYPIPKGFLETCRAGACPRRPHLGFGSFCRARRLGAPLGCFPISPPKIGFFSNGPAPGRRVTLPVAARRRKVHSTPFPPGGENCVRSLAPPLPGKPASLGFAGSNEGLGKTPPGPTPLIKGPIPPLRGKCPEGTKGVGRWPKAKGGRGGSRRSRVGDSIEQKVCVIRNPSTAFGGPPPFHKGGFCTEPLTE